MRRWWWGGMVALVLGTWPSGGRAQAASLLDSIEPKARLLLGVDASESDDYARQWGVKQARLGARLEQRWGRAEVEADLAESSVLNDAWIELRPGRSFAMTLGRFKEPFSALRLESTWNLPVLRRGAIVGAVEDAGFGGRDLGGQVQVRLPFLARLEIEAGLFQGTALGDRPPSETGVMRVTTRPWKALTLGASLGRSQLFAGDGGNALGVDAGLELDGWRVQVEALQADDPLQNEAVRGAAGYLAWRLLLDEESWLEPGVSGDLLEGAGAGGSVALGYGFADHFVARIGGEYGPGKSGGPAETQLALQLGVQL